jgi:hypothetical protein
MFGMDEKEKENLEKYFSKYCNNPNCCKLFSKYGERYSGAIGGDITYHITPTSLGCIYQVSCVCNEERVNITNFEDW